jgi:cobalt-zinc-cadmium efflux system outer membrane protein
MQRIAWRRCAWIAAAVLGLPHAARAQAPEPYPVGRDLPAFEDEPSGVLVLRHALAAALLRNPELESDSHELRAREAALVQAGAWPNPSLGLHIEDVAGSGEFRGTREAQATLQLGQLVELGGKRTARLGVAAAERDLAAWDYEVRRIEVLSRTADAFIDVLAAQARRELADESLELTRSVRRVAELRRRAGLASPAEEIRAEVQVEVAGVEREHTEHELAAARQALAAMWAGDVARFERAGGELEHLPRVPSAGQLAERLEASPGVARWQAELARREAARAQARSARVPDLALSAGPRRLSGPDETAFVVGVEIPLPLWNRNRGAIAEAEHRLAKLASDARAARVRAATELAAARVALHASAEEAKLLRTRVLPGVERALEVVRQGYEAGRFAQVEVLEAQRARIQAREQHLRALAEAHHNALEIERLTGVALEVRP